MAAGDELSCYGARRSTDMADHSPDVIPVPPNSRAVTAYDRAHFVTYLKLLDADAMGVDWKETARDVLLLDPNADTATARRAYDAHLSPARWMTQAGYR